MIKFFRNIRQYSIANGRVGKYLLYAIGEILLVVVGILIAFQVNRWNEQRKLDSQEKELLSNLRGEFQDNLKDLDSIANEVDKVIFSLETVFDRFDLEPSEDAIDSLDILLSNALASPSWKPSEYLLNNLNNSGSISNLKNERLKLLLYRWSRQQKEMLEVQNRTEKTGEEIVKYLKDHGSLRNVDAANEDFNYRRSRIFKSNKILLTDSRFENYIDDKLYMYNTTRRWLKMARLTMIQLIKETKI